MRRAVFSCVMGIWLAAAGAAAQRPARNSIDRWNQMSPAERERQLARLPPEQARRIRERIRQYNQLPPREKQDLRERYQRFLQLPHAKQELIRSRIREFRQLSPERRQAVQRAFKQLRDLPEAQRRARLDSPEFSDLSPQERQILADVTEYLAIPEK
jgi:predicted Fe-S protein YdhL (DUF1289 family)